MPMSSPNKIMGKAKSPSFFKGATSTSPTSSPIKRNMPVLLALLLIGVAIILFLRSRSSTSSASTGPVLSLSGGSAPDQSTIDNLTASILALQGQVHIPSINPGGGTSTPIAPVPDTTVPGSGNSGSGSSGVLYTPAVASRMAAAVDKVNSYGGEIRTVGPITQIPGTSAADFAKEQSANLGLVDWYKYQYAKVAAAKGGTILGETQDYISSNPDPAAYLRDVLGGGNPSFYGPNAGAPQKAADAAASAQAKAELGIT